MNAIQFLLKEHEVVRNKFANLLDESHREETKRRLFDELARYLTRHETMEEKLWYPPLMKHEQLKEIISHLISEEKEAAKKIKEIQKIKDNADWEKQVTKLKDDVDHHANEEEKKLFPKVEKTLNETELSAIGTAMREFKAEENAHA